MAVSLEVMTEAWKRASGRCQCKKNGHGHGERCNRLLVWTLRGGESSVGAWRSHKKSHPRRGPARRRVG